MPSSPSRTLISSGSPFEATYGYSRAVKAGGFVFVAGTTGYDPTTRVMPDDIAAQTQNCFTTIEKALLEAGSSLQNIVRATYYVTRANEQEAVLTVCGHVLKDIRPACTIVVVSALLKPEMRVEIEVTATA